MTVDAQNSTTAGEHHEGNGFVRMKLTEGGENLDEMIEKSLIVNKIDIPVLKDFYRSNDGTIWFNSSGLFGDFISHLKNIAGTSGGVSSGNYLNKNLKLVNPQKTEKAGAYVIITGTCGTVICANIMELEKKGCLAWKLPSQITTPKRENLSYVKAGDLLQVMKGDKTLNTISCKSYFALNPDYIAIVEGNVLEFQKLDTNGICEKCSDGIDLSSYGNIQQISFDPNRNFFVMIAEKNGMKNLVAFQKKTMKKIGEFENIHNIITFNEAFDIICLDSEGKIRTIDTNFNHYSEGYEEQVKTVEDRVLVRLEDATVNAAMHALEGGVLDVDLEKIKEMPTEKGEQNLEKLKSMIWQLKIGGEAEDLKTIFDKADESGDFDQIFLMLKSLKTMPELIKVPGLLTFFEQAINKKYLQIRFEEIRTRFTEIEKRFYDGINDITEERHLQIEIEEMISERKKVDIEDHSFDARLVTLFKRLGEKIKLEMDMSRDKVLLDLEVRMKEVSEYLETIIFIEGLKHVYNQECYMECNVLFSLLDSETRRTKEAELKDMVLKKAREFTAAGNQEKKENQLNLDALIRDCENMLGQIILIVDLETQEASLAALVESNQLIALFFEKTKQLPFEKQEKLRRQFDEMVRDKNISLKYKGSVKHEEVTCDRYGISRNLYFIEEPKKIIWTWEATELPNGKIKIFFKNNLGKRIDPDLKKMVREENGFSMTESEFAEVQKRFSEWHSGKRTEYYELVRSIHQLKIEDKEKELAELREKLKPLKERYYFQRMLENLNRLSRDNVKWFGNDKSEARPLLPKINQKTVVGPTIKKFLEDLSFSLELQQAKKQGITIVESDAGTGKNFKIGLFAALTNRELFHFSCNNKTDRSDLLYSRELGNEGTYRIASQFVEGLRTPGAVIFLDEINTLPSGIAKILNPLFDGQRYIIDPILGKVEVHPSVLFVGAMNPVSYIGTNPLPQEFASRSTIIKDEYPHEMDEHGKPSYEEAFMISKYLTSEISNMDEETFISIWNQIIVQNKPYPDASINKTFKDLRSIVKLANELRKKYKETMEMRTNEEFHFIFTIREGIDIVAYYNRLGDIKKAATKIILPKIGITNKNIELEREKKLAADEISKL